MSVISAVQRGASDDDVDDDFSPNGSRPQPSFPSASHRTPRLHRTTTIGRRGRRSLASERATAELTRCLALLAAGHLPQSDDDEDEAANAGLPSAVDSVDSGYTSDDPTTTTTEEAPLGAGKRRSDPSFCRATAAVKKVSFADEKGSKLVDVRSYAVSKFNDDDDERWEDVNYRLVRWPFRAMRNSWDKEL